MHGVLLISIVVLVGRAKLGQIQGGLQRASQDSTKGGCNNFSLFTRIPLHSRLILQLANYREDNRQCQRFDRQS